MRGQERVTGTLSSESSVVVSSGVRTDSRQNAGWASAVVWAVLVVMTFVALAHVLRDARNVPLAEDWNLVPVLAGEEPGFWSWVWSQNNEHRLPVARVLHLGLLEATRDFRAGMVFNILLTAALAAALVLVARRIRGRTSIVDAFFPIVLLHLGNWENLLWSWQLVFVIATVLVGLMLVLLAGARLPLPRTVAWVGGAVLVVLPLAGGTALPMVLPAAAALGALALLKSTHPTSRRIVVGAAILSVVLLGAYFISWERPTWYPRNPGPGATLRTSAKALTLSWGPAVWDALVPAVVVTSLLLTSAVFLLVRALRGGGPQQRRALAVAFFLGGMVLTALAIGYGRAALVPTEGLADRYALVMTPALLAAWFAWQLFGSPRLRVVVQGGLLVFAVLLLPLNVQRGYEWRDWYTQGMDAVERDIAAGMPREDLVRRHHDFLMHWNPELLSVRIELLRREGIGPFADLEPTQKGDRQRPE
jgi:hypothetical protein